MILYAASWAWTHPLAREQRVTEPGEPVQGPYLPSVDELPTTGEEQRSRKGAFVAGAAIGAAAAAAAVAKSRSDDS